MPKDSRLYMTFPIDFDEHPKVEPLSDAAFRTFVAMNGYSRRQRLDGRIPVVVARKRWRVKALAELVSSHPERPLVLIDADEYVLREYDQHQFTTADEANLYEERSSAGSKGGKASAIARANRKQMLEQTSSKPQEESESRSESGLRPDDISGFNESSHLPSGPDSELTISEVIAAKAKRFGISNLSKMHSTLSKLCGPLTPGGAVELAEFIVGKSKKPVTKVDAYVATAIRNTPEEILDEYDRLDLAGVA